MRQLKPLTLVLAVLLLAPVAVAAQKLTLSAVPDTASIFFVDPGGVKTLLGVGVVEHKPRKKQPGSILVEAEGYESQSWEFPADRPYPTRQITLELENRLVAIETAPGDAEVSVDGGAPSVGSAVVVVPLNSSVTVEARKLGFEPVQRSYTHTRGGDPLPIRDELRLTTRRVTVRSEPAGSSVQADSQSLGASPVDVAVALDSCVNVRVESENYAAEERSYCNREGSQAPPLEDTISLTRLPQRVSVRTVPEQATIQVDGREMGVGNLVVEVPLGSCRRLDAALTGFEPMRRDLCFDSASDVPDAVLQLELVVDESYRRSADGGGLVNSDFVVEVPADQGFDEAWRRVGVVVTGHFDDIDVSDKNIGYLRTAWRVRRFPSSTVRTRVIVKQTSLEPVRLSVRLVSERAEGADAAPSEDHRFTAWDRILSEQQGLISDFVARLRGDRPLTDDRLAGGTEPVMPTPPPASPGPGATLPAVVTEAAQPGPGVTGDPGPGPQLTPPSIPGDPGPPEPAPQIAQPETEMAAGEVPTVEVTDVQVVTLRPSPAEPIVADPAGAGLQSPPTASGLQSPPTATGPQSPPTASPGPEASADPSMKTTGTRVRIQAQMGHPGSSVTAVAFSSDGRLLVTGDDDSTLALWDARTGKQLLQFEAESYSVATVAFSKDGRRVLTGDSGYEEAYLFDPQTGDGVRAFEHEGLEGADLSPDGNLVVTGGDDGLARLWDAITGLEKLQFKGHEGGVTAVAFSPDGRKVLTGGGEGEEDDYSVRLWDVETGRQEKRLVGHESDVISVAFSPDGEKALTGACNTARLWSLGTGRQEQSFEIGEDDSWCERPGHSFSPGDGKMLLMAADDHDSSAVIRETATGKELHRFVGPEDDYLEAMAFSPNGGQVLTGYGFAPPALWDVATGRKLELRGSVRAVDMAAFLPDGKLVVSEWGNAVNLWDGEAGRQAKRLTALEDKTREAATEHHTSDLGGLMAFSRDGRLVVAGNMNPSYTMSLWDLEAGEKRAQFAGHTGNLTRATIARDGRTVATTSYDKTARLWDASTGEEKVRFVGHTDEVWSVALSSDSRRLLTGSSDGTARLWNTGTGEEVWRSEHGSTVRGVVFSPDDSLVLTLVRTGVRLLEAETGLEKKRFEGFDTFSSVAFSPDGQSVLTAGSNADGGEFENTAALLWDAATGKLRRRFEAPRAWSSHAVFSPDGRLVVTVFIDDRWARLWDASTGKELAQLTSFTDGTWAVVDPAGRFDASNAGDIEGLHFVSGYEPIALSQLKERYYEPGLLAKVMGFNDERLRPVEAFNQQGVELSPEITVTRQPSLADPKLGLRLENRGGGIGRVAVFLNNKEVRNDARPEGSDPNAETLDVEVDLSGSRLMIEGGENRIKFVAYNKGGYLSSPEREVVVGAASSRGGRATAPVSASGPAAAPKLLALIAGVSDYVAPVGDERNIDLRYASKDANDFANALEIAAKGHQGLAGLQIERLTDETTPATRGALEAAFKRLAAAASSTDILVVYLAGHGVSLDDDYYYLLRDARSLKLADKVVRQQAAISSRELTGLINDVPALKQVLVLDTCASGQLIEDLSASRAVSSSQTRSLERMKDRTGMFVLAGSAADAVSYEATEYGQGLLTYSLLEGMKGPALRDGEFVDVQKLFSHAVESVKLLARDVGGVQQPRFAIPRGGESFDVGQLKAESRNQITLAQKRPVVLRVGFQDTESFRDKLRLGEAVNEGLRNLSAGSNANLVFFDSDEFSKAYRLAGQYTVAGEGVTARVSVSRDDEDVGRFEIQGRMGALDALALDVLSKAASLIRDHFSG